MEILGTEKNEMLHELVSIIMPSYNTANYIGDSIKSVIDQTYKDWELIIVDDASTDETDEVIYSFKDERICYIKNKRNVGAAVSRNIALREAKGKWIAFLDSDDLWKPDKLEKQIRFMEDNNYHFSYTNYEEIDESGGLMGVIVTGPKRISKIGMYNYCWLGCLTVMYDRNAVGLVQIADIKKNNDYAIWLKVCKKATCYLLEEKLAYYRRGRRGSISSNSVIKMIVWHYRLFRDAERECVFLAILNTIRNVFMGVYKKMKFVKREQNYGSR